jgi:uncharacterized protein YpmB
MKRAIVLTLAASLFVFSWLFIYFYISILSDRTQVWQEDWQQLAVQYEGDIIQAERFHGQQPYVVLTLKHEADKRYLFIHTEDANQYASILFSEIALPREQVAEWAMLQFPVLTQIRHVRPAYLNDVFVWEVVAETESNQLQYVYFRMKNGHFKGRYIINQSL